MNYIYCDESCHLEYDHTNLMILGAINIPKDKKDECVQFIRQLKTKHGLSTWFEIKWTKVSNSKASFYSELVDYFFANKFLGFRGIVATGKSELDHSRFGNSYDDWYYKMYYYLLNPMIMPEEKYRIFIDIKDTRGGKKVNKLHDVLSNSNHDFRKEVVKDIKQIQSNESEVLQLTDLFIGALGYFNRGLYSSSQNVAKQHICNKIIHYVGRTLDQKTPVYENKFNIFIWEPRRGFTYVQQ